MLTVQREEGIIQMINADKLVWERKKIKTYSLTNISKKKVLSNLQTSRYLRWKVRLPLSSRWVLLEPRHGLDSCKSNTSCTWTGTLKPRQLQMIWNSNIMPATTKPDTVIIRFSTKLLRRKTCKKTSSNAKSKQRRRKLRHWRNKNWKMLLLRSKKMLFWKNSRKPKKARTEQRLSKLFWRNNLPTTRKLSSGQRLLLLTQRSTTEQKPWPKNLLCGNKRNILLWEMKSTRTTSSKSKLRKTLQRRP